MPPSTTRRDLVLKRARYAKFGVREYWIVNPATRWIEVLALREDEYVSLGIYSGDTSPVSAVLPGFVFAVREIFPEV